MQMRVHTEEGYSIAILESDEIVIHHVQDALDALANAKYQGCDALVWKEEHIVPDFFELSTKLAGEILQKYTNYQMKLAIVGDYSQIESKSLRDFIYECNQGTQFFFTATEEEAIAAIKRT